MDNSHITYVAGVQSGAGTQTAADSFYPAYNPTRLCLYAYHAGDEYLMADYVYTAPTANPAPAPAVPAPTPAPTAPVADDEAKLIPFTISEAKSYSSDALKEKYGSRFSKSSFTRSCARLSSQKVRCQVAWRKKPYKYSGRIDMWNDPDDVGSYIYRTSIKRSRIKSTTKKTSMRRSSPAKPSCNPNYTGVCLQNGGDVNCGDISATDFRSVGSDPFRLDGDGDGVACES
jgi:hypothetical protein